MHPNKTETFGQCYLIPVGFFTVPMFPLNCKPVVICFWKIYIAQFYVINIFYFSVLDFSYKFHLQVKSQQQLKEQSGLDCRRREVDSANQLALRFNSWKP